MTDRYAVVGNPVLHSKSPAIHTAFAKATGEDIYYGMIEAPVDGFRAAVDAFRESGGRGLNVTTPFKLDAFAMATHPSERAQLAGAVNAMKFDGDRMLAENFDGIGLVNDIEINLGYPLRGKRILLMGAGGAARGALLPFLERQPAVLHIVNRTPEKAASLAREYSGRGCISGDGYEALHGERFDIIVNATSASQRGETPAVPKSVFGDGSLAYELVYGKGLTPFLLGASEAGVARVADGAGMLVEQAAEAFLWWRGVRPDTRPLIKQLTVPLV